MAATLRPQPGLRSLIGAASALLLAACGLGAPGTPPYAGPSPLPLPPSTPAPSVQVAFTVHPPADSSPVALVLLDEVTGFAFNRRTVPMSRADAGAWGATVELPYGALQYYRYELIDSATPERDSHGSTIAARVVLVQPSLHVEDLVAGWVEGQARAGTGRVVGRLTDRSGAPVVEQIVVLAGGWAFTDVEGAFSFRDVPAGLQRITSFSPDGGYRPAQQGVLVAAGGLTPVELALEPAARVRVSFEVTVPADTAPGGIPRIAANLQQFGQRFAELPGGVRVASQATAAMTRVDDTHYLWITEIPAGTHLRYKYTLADGLWNAERTPEGFFNLRQVTVPDDELQLRDTVSSWRGQHGSVLLQATAPQSTPPDDALSIQFHPAAGFAPLPMQRLSERDWFFVLHGPLDLAAPLSYRYCRDLQCGLADDASTPGFHSIGRQIRLQAEGTGVQDVIQAWAWWTGEQAGEGIVAPEIQPRPDLEVGAELSPALRPDWLPLIRQSLIELDRAGANAVMLRPGWSVRQAGPLPEIALDPSQSAFADELIGLLNAARAVGLSVTTFPRLTYPADDQAAWWEQAPPEGEWWNAWYGAYRAFALRQADLARLGGAARIVLGGPEAAPFLPGSLTAEGQPLAPPDADGRWRGLIAEIRSRYPGRLAFALDVGRELQPPPPFLQEFDEVVLLWHAPLGERPDLDLNEMRSQAAAQLDSVLGLPELSGLAPLLVLGYPALDGGAGPCAAPRGDECRGPSGPGPGIVVPIDLNEQARAVNAVLLEAYHRPELRAILAGSYNPLVALQDEGVSAFGKPAGDVLWYWFSRLSGAASK
jgi:hypothetical protein